MKILGTEVYRRGKCEKREKYHTGENTGKYFIGYRYDRVRVSRGTNRNTGYQEQVEGSRCISCKYGYHD